MWIKERCLVGVTTNQSEGIQSQAEVQVNGLKGTATPLCKDVGSCVLVGEEEIYKIILMFFLLFWVIIIQVRSELTGIIDHKSLSMFESMSPVFVK